MLLLRAVKVCARLERQDKGAPRRAPFAGAVWAHANIIYLACTARVASLDVADACQERSADDQEIAPAQEVREISANAATAEERAEQEKEIADEVAMVHGQGTFPSTRLAPAATLLLNKRRGRAVRQQRRSADAVHSCRIGPDDAS